MATAMHAIVNLLSLPEADETIAVGEIRCLLLPMAQRLDQLVMGLEG